MIWIRRYTFNCIVNKEILHYGGKKTKVFFPILTPFLINYLGKILEDF